MSAAKKTGADPFRRKLYGKISIALKQLAIDDDAYRDMLELRYGKRSRTKLGNAQLVDLVEHLKSLGFKAPPAKRAGQRRQADSREAKKARALWLSLWHLGVVSDPSEKALNAFVRRQTGIDDLRWCGSGDMLKVIEALKGWAARPVAEGGGAVWWESYARFDGTRFENPRARVLEAQWRRCHQLGLVRISDHGALDSWCERASGESHRTSHIALSAAAADRCIQLLGEKIRAELKRRAGPAHA